jgi:hypothetical protein
VPGARDCQGSQLLGLPRVSWGLQCPPTQRTPEPRIGRSWWGLRECWAKPPWLACEGRRTSKQQSLLGNLPAAGGCWAPGFCSGCQHYVPKEWTLGGTVYQVRENKVAATLGRGGRKRSSGVDGREALVPFHGMGPAPGAQKGRTAATQVV